MAAPHERPNALDIAPCRKLLPLIRMKAIDENRHYHCLTWKGSSDAQLLHATLAMLTPRACCLSPTKYGDWYIDAAGMHMRLHDFGQAMPHANFFLLQGVFTPGKYGAWRFDKRSYAQKPPPRNLSEPPAGMPNELVRHLFKPTGDIHEEKNGCNRIVKIVFPVNLLSSPESSVAANLITFRRIVCSVPVTAHLELKEHVALLSCANFCSFVVEIWLSVLTALCNQLVCYT